MAWTARAVSTVFSDGFHTTGSPQTKASAAFHDHTATGKIEGRDHTDDTDRVPRFHHAVVCTLGRDGEAEELP